MAGFVYVMSNPSFSDLLKIGRSKSDPSQQRDEQLYTTGVPDPFIVEYYALVGDEVLVERRVHEYFSYCRHREEREFFRLNRIAAVKVIRQLAEQYSVLHWEHKEFKSTEDFLSEIHLLHPKVPHNRELACQFLSNGAVISLKMIKEMFITVEWIPKIPYLQPYLSEIDGGQYVFGSINPNEPTVSSASFLPFDERETFLIPHKTIKNRFVKTNLLQLREEAAEAAREIKYRMQVRKDTLEKEKNKREREKTFWFYFIAAGIMTFISWSCSP